MVGVTNTRKLGVSWIELVDSIAHPIIQSWLRPGMSRKQTRDTLAKAYTHARRIAHAAQHELDKFVGAQIDQVVERVQSAIAGDTFAERVAAAKKEIAGWPKWKRDYGKSEAYSDGRYNRESE